MGAATYQGAGELGPPKRRKVRVFIRHRSLQAYRVLASA
jgi:hypothetical protein